MGVVEDARYRGIQNPRLDVYLPYGQVSDDLASPGRAHRRRPAGARRRRARAGPRARRRREPGRAHDDAGPRRARLAPWRFASALLGGFALGGLAADRFRPVRRAAPLRRRDGPARSPSGWRWAPSRAACGASSCARDSRGGLGRRWASRSRWRWRGRSRRCSTGPERDPWSYLAAGALIRLVAAGPACSPPPRRGCRRDRGAALGVAGLALLICLDGVPDAGIACAPCRRRTRRSLGSGSSDAHL